MQLFFSNMGSQSHLSHSTSHTSAFMFWKQQQNQVFLSPHHHVLIHSSPYPAKQYTMPNHHAHACPSDVPHFSVPKKPQTLTSEPLTCCCIPQQTSPFSYAAPNALVHLNKHLLIYQTERSHSIKFTEGFHWEKNKMCYRKYDIWLL